MTGNRLEERIDIELRLQILSREFLVGSAGKRSHIDEL